MFIPASLCSAWVVGMVRIKWSTSIGLDGRHRSEQVVDIIGIRISCRCSFNRLITEAQMLCILPIISALKVTLVS